MDPERLSNSANPEVRALLAGGWQPRALDCKTKGRVAHRLVTLGAVTPATLLGALVSGKAAAMAIVTSAVALAVSALNLRYPSPPEDTPAKRTLAQPSALSVLQTPPPVVGNRASSDATLGEAADASATRGQLRREMRQGHTKAPLNQAAEVRSTLADELGLLERARRELAVSPALALSAVDDYRARFPAGQLKLEADVIAIRALVQSGRRSDAQQLADSLGTQAQSSLYRERVSSALGETSRVDAGTQDGNAARARQRKD
jgi:hypothetical protein